MTEITETEVLKRLDDAIKTAGSLRALAAKVGCSFQLICDVRIGRRNATGRLAEFLRVERVVVYRDITPKKKARPFPCCGGNDQQTHHTVDCHDKPGVRVTVRPR